MRIIQITPGTGSFYCGTCLRDNALVLELRARGHEALLLPMYLPIVTDETPADEHEPIIFGGINVYLQQKSAFFRKTPRWIDRLLDAPFLLRQSAKRVGMTRARDLGELTVSMLRGGEGRQIKEMNRFIAWLRVQPRPDVICLSNALLVGLARRIQSDLGVPVVCALQGEDYFLDGLESPYREQSWELLRERAADVALFIAVSHYYGEQMRARLRLPAERVAVVHNGIRLDGYEPAPSPRQPPAVGYLAFINQTKGLPTLIDAFVLLKKRDRIKELKLRIAGTLTAASEPFLQGLRARLDAERLSGDVEFLPNLNRQEKQKFLRSLSVFSVPATYGEAFGLYLLEAMASGVPVVQPRHAAFPEILAETGGGVLCEPDNANSLAHEIEKLLLDSEKARALGQQGRKAVLEKFSAERMARNVEAYLQEVVAHRPSRPEITKGVLCPTNSK